MGGRADLYFAREGGATTGGGLALRAAWDFSADIYRVCAVQNCLRPMAADLAERPTQGGGKDCSAS